MINKKSRNDARKLRHLRIRQKIQGTSSKPRLNVFRSNTHIYAQVIDDEKGITLVSASSMTKN
jgi:large subunit ribosomal protein L18